MVTTRFRVLGDESLCGQSIEKMNQFIFQMWNRVIGHRTIQIVHVPVFDAVAPLGKTSGNQWAVLGLFHGYNVIGGRQIGFREGNWKALILVVRYSFFLQTRNGVTRNWS